MPYYRLFFLDHAEHVLRGEVVACRGDAEIASVVHGLVARRPQLKCSVVEVWQSDRRLGRLIVSPPAAGAESMTGVLTLPATGEAAL